MHHRPAAPAVGRLTFPGGLHFFGESPDEIARLQMIEKLGLDVALRHRGIVESVISEQGEAVGHAVLYIYHGELQGTPDLQAKDDRFAPLWVDISSTERRELMDDVPSIVNKLETDRSFFFLRHHR